MSQAGALSVTSNPAVPTSFVEDVGSATPVANILNIVGGVGITTSGAGNTVTITNTAPVAALTLTGQSGGALSPTANNWNIFGASSIAGTSPVITSGAISTLTVNVQTSQAIASTDATKIGLAAFDSADFTVDANGFVSISSTGLAETITGDTGGALSPAASNWNILGNSPNAGITPVTTSGAGSTLTINVQKSQAIATTLATKVGLSAFDSARFTVDANGFVSVNGSGLGETITGDSGGALSPTSGNWNILGLSGTKTAGAGSSLTLKSPPYADIAAPTSVTLNSGTFATGAITLTTPVTAGLADGDLLEFVATNGVLIIQMAATQVGHIGNTATTVAGTITGTNTGDSLSLRYQASTNDWWATSVIGVWVLA